MIISDGIVFVVVFSNIADGFYHSIISKYGSEWAMPTGWFISCVLSSKYKNPSVQQDWKKGKCWDWSKRTQWPERNQRKKALS